MNANEQFGQYVRKVNAIFAEEIKAALVRLGEDSEAVARESHPNDFNDISGNLRSSIGYGVYENGRLVAMSAFRVVLNGSVGASKGASMAQSMASQFNESYHLALLAAMDYAEKVEAVNNKDVIASAELYAMRNMENYLREAVQRAENGCNAL